MKKNLFEMGADFDDGWSANNKTIAPKKSSTEIKSVEKHKLHFAKEKRRAKVVTTVKPFYLTSNDLKFLLKTLKQKLGTGGTIKENTLEFQGEVKDKLTIELKKLGYGL